MYINTEDIKFEIYVKISTGTTISQEMLKQTVNKNNIHVPIGVSQVLQLVVMILLINDCYVMSLVVIISRMSFVLYQNTPPPLVYNNTTSHFRLEVVWSPQSPGKSKAPKAFVKS